MNNEEHLRFTPHTHILAWIADTPDDLLRAYFQATATDASDELFNTHLTYLRYPFNPTHLSVNRILHYDIAHPARAFLRWFVDHFLTAELPYLPDWQTDTPRQHTSQTEPPLEQSVVPYWSGTNGLYYEVNAFNEETMHDTHNVYMDCQLHKCFVGGRCNCITAVQKYRAQKTREIMWQTAQQPPPVAARLCLSHYPRPEELRTEVYLDHADNPRMPTHMRVAHQRTISNTPDPARLTTLSNNYMNATNPVLAVAARCNTDIQLVGDATGAANYAGKYVTKAQKEDAATNTSGRTAVHTALVHTLVREPAVAANLGHIFSDDIPVNLDDADIATTRRTTTAYKHMLQSLTFHNASLQIGLPFCSGHVLSSNKVTDTVLHESILQIPSQQQTIHTLAQKCTESGPVVYKTHMRTAYLYRRTNDETFCLDRFQRQFNLSALTVHDRRYAQIYHGYTVDRIRNLLYQSIAGQRWYELPNEPFLLLARHDNAAHTLTAFAKIYPRTDTTRAKLALKPIPKTISPNLDDEAYCRRALYRFVPHRDDAAFEHVDNPCHVIHTQLHADTLEVLHVTPIDPPTDLAHWLRFDPQHLNTILTIIHNELTIAKNQRDYHQCAKNEKADANELYSEDHTPVTLHETSDIDEGTISPTHTTLATWDRKLTCSWGGRGGGRDPPFASHT